MKISILLLFLAALSKRTRSAETFLLASAALANLTFMEPSTVNLMIGHGTVDVLVSAGVDQPASKGASIYIQDQVAAVLANMASSSECRGEVVKAGGLPLLLKFLHVECPAEETAQVAATERVLQKSAIAVSR